MFNTNFLKNSFDATKIMYNLDKRAYIKNFAVGIVQTIMIVANTILMQFFIDALGNTVGNNKTIGIIALLIGLAVVTVLSEIINGYQNYLYGYYIDNGVKILTDLLHEKISEFERIKLDDSNELANIERARKGVGNLVELVLVLGDAITFYGLYFILLGIYFFSIDKKMIIILPMIFVPVMLSHLSKIKIFSDMDEKISMYKIQMKHFISCFTKNNYLREMKYLNAEAFFKNKFYESLKSFQHEIFSTNKKAAKKDFIGKMLTFIGTVAIILLLTAELINGNITVGVFGAVFAALKQMFSLMDELISVHFGDAMENIGTVEATINLINEKNDTNVYNDYTDFTKIKFNNVSFTYPHQKKSALDNISFEIHKGEKIALVGPNGSGKSTLSKLIIGLYKPSRGLITVDKSKLRLYKDKRTAIFQEYVKYKMSVEDNIKISDFDKKESVKSKIDLYAKDLKIDLHTRLGKEFGNEDLSGGQWQSLAIARGFYKDAGLIILDEPTAAIDPIKEDSYYSLFQQELKDKTAILVTHHLASVKIADRIIYLKDGRIKEEGSFDKLMLMKGEFYKLYSTQANKYKK